MSGLVLSAMDGNQAQATKLVATAAVRNLAFNIRFILLSCYESAQLCFPF
jgi:hypothetical protein